MPIKLNFNVCDNSPECSGKAVCPTNAIFWDAEGINVLGEKGVLCIDNGKCISCGQCVGDNGCPVGAIVFDKTEEGLAKLTKDLEIDVNKVKALFVERYGAEPIDESICIKPDDVDSHISEGVTVIEEFAEWSIQCLLSSIPIEDVLKSVSNLTGATSVHFFKCDCTESKSEQDTLPSLKVYRDHKLISQIDGVYDASQFDDLKSALKLSHN